MFTIISTVNNASKAKEYLLKGLARQTSKHQLIIIDNEKGSFKSAASAYNSATQKATGDYLMFVHQDVFLPTNNWLQQAEDALSSLSKTGLVGVAGMVKPKAISQLDACLRFFTLKRMYAEKIWFLKYGRGNVIHGKNRSLWHANQIKDPATVQTVDELLLIIPAEVFKKTKFDESTCKGWHLYGTDYSLSIQAQGYQTYVLPFWVFHASEGKTDSSFHCTMSKLVKKHKKENIINTTNGLFPTNPALFRLFYPN